MGEPMPERQACAELSKVSPLNKFRCDLCCPEPTVAANAAAGAAFTAGQAAAAAVRFRHAFVHAEQDLLERGCFHCALEFGGGAAGSCQRRHQRWPRNQCVQCCSTTHSGIQHCPLFGNGPNLGRCYRCLRPKAGPNGGWTCTNTCSERYGSPPLPPLRAIGLAVRVLEWAVSEGACSPDAAAFVADVKEAAGAEAVALAAAAALKKKGASGTMEEREWLPVARSLLTAARQDAKEVCRAQVLLWLAHRRTGRSVTPGFEYRALF
jgi:hypothetical protein